MQNKIAQMTTLDKMIELGAQEGRDFPSTAATRKALEAALWSRPDIALELLKEKDPFTVEFFRKILAAQFTGEKVRRHLPSDRQAWFLKLAVESKITLQEVLMAFKIDSAQDPITNQTSIDPSLFTRFDGEWTYSHDQRWITQAFNVLHRVLKANFECQKVLGESGELRISQLRELDMKTIMKEPACNKKVIAVILDFYKNNVPPL